MSLPQGIRPYFLCGSAGKESPRNAGDLGSIPGLGRSPGEGKGFPLQYSGLENSMDCIVHGGRKGSDTTKRLSLLSSSYMSCFRHEVKRSDKVPLWVLTFRGETRARRSIVSDGDILDEKSAQVTQHWS